MAEELKPCPFCGGAATIDGTEPATADALSIGCTICYATTYQPLGTRATLIEMWNGRKSEAVMDRTYQPPIDGADWSVSAVDLVAVTLSIALSQRVPGWPGATDEQLDGVAREIIAALDGRPMEQAIKKLKR